MGDRSQAVRSAAAVAILLGGGYTVATVMNGAAVPSAAPPDQPGAAAAAPTPQGHDHAAHGHDDAHAARGDGTSNTVAEVDGYTVRLVEDALVAGCSTQLRVTITGPDGEPARLRPYLAGWAHAALVNADSLSVSHLHPLEEYAPGVPSPRELVLSAAASDPGDHRLVVEFATESGVHQAEFTVRAVA